MHPADECDAFRDLIDKGTPIADIAARFGVTETFVKQRLKLARVSPVVIAAYRKDEIEPRAGHGLRRLRRSRRAGRVLNELAECN